MCDVRIICCGRVSATFFFSFFFLEENRLLLQFTNESPLLDPRSLARQPVAALKVWASQPPFRRKKKRKGKKRGGRSGVTQALQARKFTSSHQPAVAGLGAVVVGGQAAWLRRSSWPRAARGDRETPDYLESQGAGYLPSPSPVWVFFFARKVETASHFLFLSFSGVAADDAGLRPF